jgi:hypothetical protein
MAKSIGVLAKLHLELAGHAAQVVPFSHNRSTGFNFFVMTGRGLEARAQLAKAMSEEQLQSLRSAPRADGESSPFCKMQLLHDAGLLTCPCTGLPIFDTSHAPPSLWRTLNDLANAVRASRPLMWRTPSR